jgi:hypothetical protein
MRLVFLTKYTFSGASSRYRSFLYFNYLTENYGYNISHHSFFDDIYLYKLYNNERNNIFKLLYLIFKRIFFVLFKLKQSDIVFIEYEIIPFFPPILEFYLKKRNIKYILDYDDAIFHNYDSNRNILIKIFLKNKIPLISKSASAIITGSAYLSNYFSIYNQNIFEIPTSVPFEYYQNISNIKKDNSKTYIGWIGSKTTSPNVLPISNLINKITELRDDIIFIFCGFDNNYKYIFNEKVVFLDWNSKNEQYFLSKIDIGIMPLIDNDFNKGKCGFKLVQYMAVGIPTIATPFQSNIDIDNSNGNLFANNIIEWEKCIYQIVNQKENFKIVGVKNKKTIKEKYSVESNVFYIHKIIKSIS